MRNVICEIHRTEDAFWFGIVLTDHESKARFITDYFDDMQSVINNANEIATILGWKITEVKDCHLNKLGKQEIPEGCEIITYHPGKCLRGTPSCCVAHDVVVS